MIDFEEMRRENCLLWAEQSNCDWKGLSDIWGIPRDEVTAWRDGKEPFPKWAENYLALIKALHDISVITHMHIGDPYE